MANQEQLDILEQGVDVWNKWRINHPNTEVDLSESDLSGARLNDYNLADADLGLANLGGVDLVNASLIDSDLSSADLTDTNLTGTDLRLIDRLNLYYKKRGRVALSSSLACSFRLAIKIFFYLLVFSASSNFSSKISLSTFLMTDHSFRNCFFIFKRASSSVKLSFDSCSFPCRSRIMQALV